MPRWVNHRWLTVATVGLGTSLLIAGFVWLTVNIVWGKLDTSDQLASVVSAYVGICGLVATVIGTVFTARQSSKYRGGSTTDARSSLAQSTRPWSVPADNASSDDPGVRTGKLFDRHAASVVESWPEIINYVSLKRWNSMEAEQWHHKAVPVPRQLPAHSSHFVGRAAELHQLTALLDTLALDKSTMIVAAIRGTPGVGKTALALRWAHTIVERFPDGQLYINLRGFDPSGNPVLPAEAVRGFLDAFEIPPERIPVSLDAQMALYRSLLAERRVLVVLDNARDSDQVRPLLPGSPSCLVVVTSRNQLTGLVAAEGAKPLNLNLFTVAEACELLARHLGAERVVGEPQIVEELIGLCARLPLALAIVSVWASTHPGFPLAVLVSELRDARTRLDTLNGGDQGVDIRAVFSWSYRYLSAEVARTFRLLGVHPGPDISLSAAASLIGIPLWQAREALGELTRAHLLVQNTPGRFIFHDLLRAYANDRACAEDSDVERNAAMHRVLDYYLHTAHTAVLLLHPSRDPLTLAPPQPGAAPEDLATDGHALAWLEAEHRVLLMVIVQAASSGFDTHAWQLPWSLGTFFDRRGHWHDWAATQHIALAAAGHLGDQDGQARAHRGLGQAHIRLGSAKEAQSHLRHALDLYQQLGDRVGQAHTHLNMSWAFGQQRHDNEALGQAQQALRLYQGAGHRDGQARALNAIGWYYARLGNLHQALAHCEKAFTLFHNLGNRLGEAATWDSLGYAHHHLGHHPHALACYQHALNLWQKLGNRYYQATTLTHLGDAHHASDDPAAACKAWQQALTILDDLHHIDADEVRAKLHHATGAGVGGE